MGLTIFNRSEKSVALGFQENDAKLELIDIGAPVNRAKAFGRIAFSCPHAEQEIVDQKIRSSNQTIVTPLVSLDTPGKATVRVIILADPDGHEICFVDDEAFRELSKVDAKGVELLDFWIKKEEP